jgi:radical SAM superfamily enzyme YgiQ (UPF0313 family)
MRQFGTILLISCYELGHQPFHLASLSAILQQAGYQPRCVDTAVEPLTDEVISQAYFVGISVPMHTALRLGEQIARRVRSINPQAHICLYGLYASLNANHLLKDAINSTIGGEYEIPLLRLIQALEQGDTSPVAGVHTPTNTSGPWLQRTPFLVPERQHLPALTAYAHLQWNGECRLAGYTEATRGCKHTCLHCPITPIYNGRFFAVPADLVLADIRAQVERGAQHITFGDPDFWNGPTHALRIVRRMHAEFPTLTFDATIKIEHLLKHRHLLPEFKELGCLFIVSAVESLNDNVLQHLEKGHTAADAIAAFTLTEQAGIALRPSLLPFTPWETLESYIKLLSFFETHHLIEHIDPVHLSIRLLIPPGSALLPTTNTSPLPTSDASIPTPRRNNASPLPTPDASIPTPRRNNASPLPTPDALIPTPRRDNASRLSAPDPSIPTVRRDNASRLSAPDASIPTPRRDNASRLSAQIGQPNPSVSTARTANTSSLPTWIGELDPTAYSHQWQHPDPRMDELQAKIATLVSQAENTQTDPLLTFLQVKELALKMQGQRYSVFRALRAYGPQKAIPHLSESWFCCAEPPSLPLSGVSILGKEPDT